MFNYFEDYGYDSCTSRGVCSISPRMASIYEILLLYLKEFAYYSLKLESLNIINNEIKNLIINSLSAFVSNPEIPDDIFAKIICTYTKELEVLKNQYINNCNNLNIPAQIINSKIDTDKNCNVIHSIRLGEQNFLEKSNDKSKHYVQELLFFTAKSLTVYLLELNSYGENSSETILMILEILNTLNIEEINEQDLKSLLLNSAEIEYSLVKKIETLKEKLYGTPTNIDVSLSTAPNKAIMVDGTNIKELVQILEATKNLNIDIYTHGEMLSAHSYPEIQKYQHLKGHYGHGSGKSILDFSTFPGAIFVGRHSINNVENLYRGRLYTTDIVVPQGVIKIENDNFEPLIEAGLDARGFKHGKKQAPVSLFLNRKALKSTFDNIKYDNYEAICLISQDDDSYENKNYFDKILKLLPNDILIINFNKKFEGNNIVNINTGYNFNTLFEVIEILKNKIDIAEKPIITFVPRCDKHVTNFILNLQHLGVKKVFMGKCPAKNLNPSVVNKFCELFNVHQFSSVKEDYKTFIDELSL